MIDGVLGHVRDQLRGSWTAPGLAGVVVAGVDKDPASNITMIVFDDGGAPSIVAKVGRRPGSESTLRTEHDRLVALRSLGSRTLSAEIPEPLGIEWIGGRLVLFMSALPGEPLTTHYYAPGHVSDARSVERDFALAGAWLARFQDETTRGSIRLDDRELGRWIDPVVDRYRREIGWAGWERRFFDVVTRRAKDVRGRHLPLVGVHGDYWMGNILVEGRRLTGLVDWERAQPTGLPFSDIYKFPTSYGFYLDRASPGVGGRVRGHPGRDEFRSSWRRFGDWPNLVGFAYAFFGRGWFPEQVRRYVTTHLARLDAPKELNAVFFPIFLADQATALADPSFREGYRSLLRAFAEERDRTWLWTDGVAA